MQDSFEFTEVYGHIESQHINFTAMAALPQFKEVGSFAMDMIELIELIGFIPIERRGEDDIEPFIARISRKKPRKSEPKPVARTSASKLLSPNDFVGIGTVYQLPDSIRFFAGIEAEQFDRLLPLVTAKVLETIQITYEPPVKKGGRPQITSITFSTDLDLKEREDEIDMENY
jgi:hypothetical protein